MKQFEDLVFKPHPTHNGILSNRLDFANGLSMSVILTDGSYGGSRGDYEAHVCWTDPDCTDDLPEFTTGYGEEHQNNGITFGFLSIKGVNKLMKDVQQASVNGYPHYGFNSRMEYLDAVKELKEHIQKKFPKGIEEQHQLFIAMEALDGKYLAHELPKYYQLKVMIDWGEVLS